jgi:ketosteroid isomerase-like protein
MNEAEIQEIIKKVKGVFEKMTEYSEVAELDSFINCYDNSPTFLHFSSDGKMRNYQEFKEICTEYYSALKEQKILTNQEKIHVISVNLVVLGWTGDISAQYKSGDIMKINNYSITSVFKKIDNSWKIIHSHESSLPPEFIKREK